jgi:hypothetical protein
MKIDLKTPTEKMFIPSRTKKALLFENINNVQELLSFSKADLMKMPNLGKKSVNDICKMLSINEMSLFNDFKSIDDYVLNNHQLSLKDKFAQSALQGLLAFHGTHNDKSLVVTAFNYAEMMMEQRNG